MWATGGGPPGPIGPPQQIRGPTRRRERSRDVIAEPLDQAQGSDTGTVGRRDESHEVERAADQRGQPTDVAAQERTEEDADDGREAQPGLSHRRFLVPEQDRVERAGERAEPRRDDGRQRQAEGAGHDPAGVADALVTGGGTAADATDPGPGSGHAERVRRRKWSPRRVRGRGRGRGRDDAGERSPWPG